MRTVYIDDDEKELKKYTNVLITHPNSMNKFEIIPINAQKEFEKLIMEVKNKDPQLILLDFKLDKPNNLGKVIEISGAPLSTAFKEMFPEVPVVFFTKKDIFGEKESALKIYSNVDATVYKSDIYKTNGKDLNFLYQLAEGFGKLRNNHLRKFTEILKLINSPEDDYNLLKLSTPPTLSLNSWSVSGAADWIINILLKYPGILYNSAHSATLLGISKNAFESEAIKIFFAGAKYSGVFEPLEGCWWRSRLQELAESIMNEDEKRLLVREGFPIAWERENNTTIERPKCIYSGESPAEWVCYILEEPVMIKYSLSYQPDSRPSVMDEARISFQAIKASNKINEDFLDPIELEIYAKIRNYNGG